MKLIIDIPEEEYRKVRDGRASVSMMRNAIKSGIPLDDVRAKIADIETYERDGYWVMTDVWIILNNIGKESEE